MREMKMLANKKQYDLVSEDGYDSRIPLHNDDAFNHGIHFQAKYIGTLDVPRPSSRVEIVAAMRRIRYEFKAKAIKKKKVSLTISIDGVKVSLRKKRKKSSHSHWSTDDNKLLVMHHPIFRIFYVSHDSQDLKIWSYIARDGPTNIFKCNVFKAYKKSQAMRIVRTIGQAFEVCHKLSITGGQMTDTDRSGHFSEDSDLDSKSNKEREQKNNKQKEKPETVGVSKYDGKVSPPAELALKQAQDLLLSMAAKTPRPESGTTVSSTLGSPVLAGDVETESHYSLTSHHQMQLLRQQVEQQQHQTQIAVSQIHLLKDQLAAESAARIEAQARAHQLLLHNRVMLDQMSELVHRLQELEIKIHGVSPTENLLNLSTEMPIMLDPTTPQVGPVYTPEMESLNESYLSAIPEPYISKNDKSEFDTDSPDSGHKEMSSESLSLHILKPDGIYWQSLLKGQPVSFSSPETFMSDQSGHIVDFSSVTGNPFANGFEDDWDHSQYLKDREGVETIITPLPQQDASGNRLELKLTKTPKIDPPPEFRNSKSYRDSQISEQSQDSSSSSQDGNVQLKIDSDYFSTTASNASSQVNHNSNTDWGQNQNHEESRFDKYFTEKHENNNASSRAKHELNLDLVGITSLESSTKGDNSSNSPVVSHSLDSPSSQTKLIIKPAPPPPPPRRTETTLSYNT